MTQEDFQKHVLQELKEIKESHVAHREEYIKEVTRINTERKIEARLAGGFWGLIASAFLLIFKWAWDHIAK